MEKEVFDRRSLVMKRSWKVLLLLLVLISLFIPVNTHAAKIKIKYNGTKKTYARKTSTVYINGKKKNLKTTPIFMKSGTYMGPLNSLFRDSTLKVGCKENGEKITLTYNGKTLVLKNGTRTAKLNGVTEKKALGAIAMKGVVYQGTKTKRWVVPLKSVCKRLGISYSLKNGAVYLGTSTANTTTTQKQQSSTETTQEAASTANVGKVVLVLDAGHGGTDSGAAANGYKEKNLNLAILLGAKKYFDNDNRFKVFYTRVADTYPTLDDRCKLANDNKADLFISIHINYVSNTSITGTLTLRNENRNNATKKNGITSVDLSAAMQAAVLKTTGFTNRGLVNRTDLRVLNKTNMPACLIEYGFISNSKQAKIMHANTDRYGKELYEAIVAYMTAKGKIK